MMILVSKSVCERKSCKESTNAWDEQLELGLVVKTIFLMFNYAGVRIGGTRNTWLAV